LSVIKSFQVSYLAIDASLSYLKVDYFSQNFIASDSVYSGTGIREISGIKTLAASVDFTHTISIIPLLVGLQFQSVNNSRYIVNWKTTLRSATTVSYNLSISGTTTVQSITSYILVYDKTIA
jgi:hypothetical protein